MTIAEWQVVDLADTLPLLKMNAKIAYKKAYQEQVLFLKYIISIYAQRNYIR